MVLPKNAEPATVTVEVGPESPCDVTLPDVHKCWKISILYHCGHRAKLPAKVDYLGSDKDLSVEINPHGSPCKSSCDVERLAHVLNSDSAACRAEDEVETK
jgi:hypothetical protein